MYSESDSASASEGETSYMESVTVEAQKSRPKRDVRPSRKVREQEQRNEPGGIQAAATDGKHDKFIVKCEQTGVFYTATQLDFFVNNETLDQVKRKDLVKGASLVMEQGDKMYTVMFIREKPEKDAITSKKRGNSDNPPKDPKKQKPWPFKFDQMTKHDKSKTLQTKHDKSKTKSATKDASKTFKSKLLKAKAAALEVDKDSVTENAFAKEVVIAAKFSSVDETKVPSDSTSSKDGTSYASFKDGSNSHASSSKDERNSYASISNDGDEAAELSSVHEIKVPSDSPSSKDGIEQNMLPTDPDERFEFLLKKVISMDEKLDWIKKSMKRDRSDGPEMTIKGVNVQRMRSEDGYAYGLQLMDFFFSKEEQHASLLVSSSGNKSEKPPLNKEKVEKIFKLIEEKYKNDKDHQKNWDPKKFIAKANQKCQDALRLPKKEKVTVMDEQ